MHSSIGKLFDLVDNYDIGTLHENEDHPYPPGVQDSARMVISRLYRDVPHYVADQKIIDLIARPEVQKGFIAMAIAGVARMPFDPVLVEFRDVYRKSSASCFIRIQSKPVLDTPLAQAVIDFKPDYFAYAMAMSKDQRPGHEQGYVFAMNRLDDPVLIRVEHNGLLPYTISIGGTGDKREDRMKQELSLDVAEAVSIAFLMLNTRGIEKVPVSMAKLNKARASSSNKPPINDFNVLRIGHIYDRSGKAHSVEGSGRHMPIHWRAGHIRHPRTGPAKTAEGEWIPKEQRGTSMVFVPPCLVNFDPGEAAPTPKREVTL